jgi:chorismate mutase-like protein
VSENPDLEALRREIDAIDAKILQLVAARVRVVLAVGDLKRTLGVAIYDPERERAMLERLGDHIEPPLDRDTVKRIFERLIDESRRLEQRHVHE